MNKNKFKQRIIASAVIAAYLCSFVSSIFAAVTWGNPTMPKDAVVGKAITEINLADAASGAQGSVTYTEDTTAPLLKRLTLSEDGKISGIPEEMAEAGFATDRPYVDWSKIKNLTLLSMHKERIEQKKNLVMGSGISCGAVCSYKVFFLFLFSKRKRNML